MFQNILPRSILENSISLNELGIKEVAFDQEHVYDVVNWCVKNKITILGGDVYKINCSKVESLGDSWYFEPNNLKTDCENSCKKATEYVKKYM